LLLEPSLNIYLFAQSSQRSGEAFGVTEDEARAWLSESIDVSRETLMRLEALVAAVVSANTTQNLISAATVDSIWSRHVVDSAQLLPLAPTVSALPWLDLGTGAGFPGLVIAALRPEHPMILVESRRLRYEFLGQTAETMGLSNVIIHTGSLESLADCAVGVISARAFAPLAKLLTLAHRFSRKKTVWLLPKGRNAQEELASIKTSWQGSFHVEQSITDAESAIIVAKAVQPRK
jgi:16S rRNA (guanine527-N7)-methyltransferase